MPSKNSPHRTCKPNTDAICKQCGRPFRYYKRASVAPYEFCSRACGAENRRGRFTGPSSPVFAGRIDLTCEVCNSVFSVKPGDVHKRRTCSRSCAYALKANALEQYRVDPASGCWVWIRYVDAKGYARLSEGRKKLLAHRAFYERRFGPIPTGLELDHNCGNPSCVNPEHLTARTPVDHRERHKQAA